MDFDTSYLLLALTFGILGTAYFVFGKKQQDFIFMLFGLGLMSFSYFTEGALQTGLFGMALTLGPFLWRSLGR